MKLITHVSDDSFFLDFQKFLQEEAEAVRLLGIDILSEVDESLDGSATDTWSSLNGEAYFPRIPPNVLNPFMSGISWASAETGGVVEAWRERTHRRTRQCSEGLSGEPREIRLVVMNPGNQDLSSSDASVGSIARDPEILLLRDARSQTELETNPLQEVESQRAEIVLSEVKEAPKGSPILMPTIDQPISLRRWGSSPPVPDIWHMAIQSFTKVEPLTVPNLLRHDAANNEDITGWHADREDYHKYMRDKTSLEGGKGLRRAYSERRVTREELASSQELRSVYKGSSRWSISVKSVFDPSGSTLVTTPRTSIYQPTLVAVPEGSRQLNFQGSFSHGRQSGNAILAATGRYRQLANSNTQAVHQRPTPSNSRRSQVEFPGSRDCSPPWHDKVTGMVRRLSGRRRNERLFPMTRAPEMVQTNRVSESSEAEKQEPSDS